MSFTQNIDIMSLLCCFECQNGIYSTVIGYRNKFYVFLEETNIVETKKRQVFD